ncbi:MAG: DsbA family protein [Pseudomonadales bacterium]|nr:DsbA family protein [Pseudomonadales bacterium]
MTEKTIQIDYFSDVLCVWAHVSQARVDELKKQFGSQVQLHHHFIPVFGCVKDRIEEGWKDRGGYGGFNQHVQEISAQFPHIEICEELWEVTQPTTSLTSHLFLKSAQLLEDKSIISDQVNDGFNGNSLFEELVWRTRQAFFKHRRDISRQDVLLEIAEELKLPMDLLIEQMTNGEAFAGLHRDMKARDHYRLEGSPTYVLNNGRQKLYGNVGYKILEANVREILSAPDENYASWC